MFLHNIWVLLWSISLEVKLSDFLTSSHPVYDLWFMSLWRSHIPTHVCASMLTDDSSAFRGIHSLRVFMKDKWWNPLTNESPIKNNSSKNNSMSFLPFYIFTWQNNVEKIELCVLQCKGTVGRKMGWKSTRTLLLPLLLSYFMTLIKSLNFSVPWFSFGTN